MTRLLQSALTIVSTNITMSLFKELPPHRLAEIRRFFEDCILFVPLNVAILLSIMLTFTERKQIIHATLLM